MAAATTGPGDGSPSTIISRPNATLYVANIDWKIKKPLLRRALYSLFSRHGKVLEVITLRREGLRGQAFIIYDDVSSATAALQIEQGFTFFGKDLKIAYAKETSDRIAKRDGTYVPKAKRQKLKQQQQQQEQQQSSSSGGLSIPPPPPPPPPPPLPTEGGGASDDADDSMVQEQVDKPKPSHILFAQDLPKDCNEMALAMLFRQYNGFKEVRIPRPGLAFCEFDDEPHATVALEGLNGFQLTQADKLKLTYGKS